MNLNFPVQGDNLAGIKLFYFTPVENIESETSDDVILKSGKTWYTGKAKKYTLSFSERSRRSRSGNVFNNSLIGYIAKRTNALDSVLNNMIGRDFVVMAEDLNGRKWIIGTIDQPLTFELSSNSGSRPGENSGVEFTFSGKATEITKPVGGIPTTSGEVIEDENGNTLPHHRHKAEDITGTKTSSFISDFADSVRATVLKGLSTATNSVITAQDTVLGALGKLQKQVTDHKVMLDGKEDADQFQFLSDAAPVVWDWSKGKVAEVEITTDRALSITNATPGHGRLIVWHNDLNLEYHDFTPPANSRPSTAESIRRGFNTEMDFYYNGTDFNIITSSNYR